MSISGTMSSALSGLTTAARSAEIISSNIANALTDGYGRRELQISSRQLGSTGQGVQVVGVSREINQALVADRRIADATASNLSQQTDFLSGLAAAFGSPEDASSFTGRFAAFDTALLAASAEPESTVRQSNVIDAARSLAASFRTITSGIQTARSDADAKIAAEVSMVNRSLASIADLNTSIAVSSASGRDPSALLDQRQTLIGQVATIIPLREVQADNGKVSLYSTSGATLLESRPATLSFSAVGIITPDMTLASGALSGLSLNGRPLGVGTVGGGSLAANFTIRDALAPAAQTELDAVARDLITRFQDPSVDPSLGVGDAGLFTDTGSAFLSTDEDGIAARIGINAVVDPAAGGAVWRIRDGLGASSPGPVGDSRLLSAMQNALNDPQTTASGQFSGAARGALSLAAKVVSAVTDEHLLMETEAGFSAARATALQSLALEGGIDTDRELQDLLLVEQAYAANAKVIQTTDDMIQILLGM